ncbi:lipoate--protein ligase family protein [Vibrio intestinalis]|uniref:lipoate--protein ligase family protein n=1 Tax=Vibrio intestinalis TaxID=2933291 RepID=UPI0021A7948F|nr:lipoate--protein ligase [Vibrio intestinalis]
MSAKNKLVRYKSIDVTDVFEKERQLIEQVQQGELEQVLLLWQAKQPTLVLPSGRKWPHTSELENTLNRSEWLLSARKTGGAPVPQLEGIINLSHIYHWPDGQPYDIKQAYLDLCGRLSLFFARLGVAVDVHVTEGSYCDGDYNLNIEGRKVVGTAQRVLLKKEGGKVVLSQACIIIRGDSNKLVEPVRLCNQLSNQPNDIRAEVHTALAEHIDLSLTTDGLYQAITQAFLDRNS